MQPSERVTGIADRLMDEAEVQNAHARDATDGDVHRMMNLASSKALLTMAQVLRVTAAELRADEAGNGGETP
jgi:hypothetical protein